MDKYPEPIGRGGMWNRDGKRVKYFSWTMEFSVNANIPIKVSGVAFKNDKKESENSPDYRIIVNKWEYPKDRERKEQPEATRDEEDIPF